MGKGYKLGEVTPIFVIDRSVPPVVTKLDDGTFFIPLECTVEEGERIATSLAKNINKRKETNE